MYKSVLLYCVVFSLYSGGLMAEDDNSPNKPMFDIWEIQVKGNTLLTKVQIEKLINPYVGPNKSVDDVEAARKRLETYYKTNGYPTVYVDIPEQDVRQGVVKLTVAEGEIGNVTVTGARYYSPDKIKSMVASATHGDVLFVPAFQDDISLVNELSPNYTLIPKVSPGKLSQTIDVEFKVQDKLPLSSSVELNNRYSSNTSDLRLGVNLGYSNLWQKNHSVSFFTQMTPEKTDEIRVYSLTYLFSLPKTQHMVALYSVRSNSDIAVLENDVQVLGEGSTYGLNWIIPFARSKQASHRFTIGADYKDNNDIIAAGDDSEDTTTPISYSVFAIEYQFNRFAKNNSTQFSIGPHFSFRALSDESIDDCKFEGSDGGSFDKFDCKRKGASANFLYYSTSFSQKHSLPLGGAMQLSVNGQYSDVPLVSNEQFSIGGVNSVRGYPESHVLGDYGARVSLEWLSPDLPIKYAGVKKAFLVSFIDAGAVFLRSPLVGQDYREGILGVGLGGNLVISKYFRAALDFAWPKRRSNDIDENDWRTHFSIAISY